MSISVPEKAAALLEVMTRQRLAEMPPAQRQRLAAQCRRVAEMAEMMDRPIGPKSGVLYDLKASAGYSRHE